MRIGLVSCKILPEPDPDQAPLLAALRRRGHEAAVIPWDESSGEFIGCFDLLVMRSAWNYYEAPEQFLEWCARVDAQTTLLNPPDIIRWNHHKSYLAKIRDRGVPIVSTRWFQRRRPPRLPELMKHTGWKEIVIKPAISAASFRTKRFGLKELEEAQCFAIQLASERDLMVQEHMQGFHEPGERSLIWIDGHWTHAVLKRPRFTGEHEGVEASHPPGSDELQIANGALEPLKHRLLYARVDIVRDSSNLPVVSEVELIEPSLFFDRCPGALDRFVAALEGRRTGAPG